MDKLDLGKHADSRKKITVLVTALAPAFLLAVLALNFVFDANIRFKNLTQDPQVRLETLSFIMFAAMTITAAIFLVLALVTRHKKVFLTLMVPLLVLDLFVFGINYNTTSEPDQVFFKTESIEYIKQDQEKGRVLGVMGGTFNPNSMWIFGLEDM